jgi:glycosyltransferase involved in cell wall biosynthesis
MLKKFPFNIILKVYNKFYLFIYSQHLGKKNLLERKKLYSSFLKKDGQLRLLLVYNRVSHHMAEFVNIALRKRFPEIQVYACGPNNEFDIKDSPKSHSQIVALASKLSIDVLWELESGYVSNDFQFKRKYGSIDAVKIWWLNDSHQFLDMMVKKASDFDRVYVSMKDDLPYFPNNASWLPGSVSIDVALDYHLPRIYDISFVGSLDSVHSNRIEILKKLSAAFPQINIKKNIFMEDMAREYSSTKIVFNMSLKKDLNYRVFEALACGAMLITDRIDNGLLQIFEEDVDLVVYDTFSELKEKVSYYLLNDEKRISIAKSGQLKVLQRHTVDHRISNVLNDLPELLKRKGKAQYDNLKS